MYSHWLGAGQRPVPGRICCMVLIRTLGTFSGPESVPIDEY